MTTDELDKYAEFWQNHSRQACRTSSERLRYILGWMRHNQVRGTLPVLLRADLHLEYFFGREWHGWDADIDEAIRIMRLCVIRELGAKTGIVVP